MLTMAVGQSDDVDPGDAIDSAIEQCRAALKGQAPQAGILFATFDSFGPETVAAVREAFPGIGLIGATSAAEMSSVNGYQEDSVTLSVFASDVIDITVGVGGGLGTGIHAGVKTATDSALAGTKRDPKVCIVVTEAFVVDPQQTLDALSRALPEGVVLLGGAAARSDFNVVTPSYQFCNETIVADGLAIMLFSGPLFHSMAVGTGWKTIGARGRVTRGEHGAIHEIDNRPATEFLARYLDVTGPSTFGNPFAVFEEGSDEFYMRTIQAADTETGTVIVLGSIPVGAMVQLTTADTDEIIAGTGAALARAHDAYPAGAQPEAALIFSCAVRKFLLGSRTNREAELVQSTLGASVPMAGMYCFGEVGPVRGTASSRFLNETFVALLLGT